MAKVMMVAVLVLQTIQCLIEGKSITFLPSDKEQKIPKDAADDAVKLGKVKRVEKKTKPPKPTNKKPAASKTEGEGEGEGGEGSNVQDPDGENQGSE